MTNIYGYARVSSKDQNEARQIIALSQFPVKKENIYIDKFSGKDFDRPKYSELIKILKEQDILVIKEIDRLGRNYEEILEQWRVITKEIKADIVVLDMPLLNTRTRKENLTGTFIADLVLQILSYVAETERQSIKQRQREGIEAAKKRGVKFGRPCIPVPEEFYDLKEKWLNKKITSREAATTINVSQDTFLRWVHLK
ncbi:recombinase family protein [Erysipelatoclostridium ramosum]|uniref:recombinase family protein n=1 Tax=Thomasclavelia ramosa TaxID=1547 RepID=UPI0018AA3F91|nr:recombinase family protein [Thomasclavelia ramosa]MDB7094113.1 recombinase family protein [Thomasclavelia ramosa]